MAWRRSLVIWLRQKRRMKNALWRKREMARVAKNRRKRPANEAGGAAIGGGEKAYAARQTAGVAKAMHGVAAARRE